MCALSWNSTLLELPTTWPECETTEVVSPYRSNLICGYMYSPCLTFFFFKTFTFLPVEEVLNSVCERWHHSSALFSTSVESSPVQRNTCCFLVIVIFGASTLLVPVWGFIQVREEVCTPKLLLLWKKMFGTQVNSLLPFQ